MADQNVDTEMIDPDVPEIPELLEKVLVFSLEEAKEKALQGGEVVPFTALVVKENLFIENHPGDSAEECFNYAQHTVEGARGADAYAFCYDGYIETDDGTKDALIAEGGLPGEEGGIAVGCLYEVEGGNPKFEEEIVYIGDASNFMSDLKESDMYNDDEIDDRYLDEDDEEMEDE